MKTIAAREHFDEAVTEDVREKAIERGLHREQAGLHATSLKYLADRHAIDLGFGDFISIVLPVTSYEELAALSVRELEALTLGFDGRALCLEERDLHVSIAGMMAANEPIKNIAASLLTQEKSLPRVDLELDKFGTPPHRPAMMRRHINLDEIWEVQYLARKLSVSKEELEEVVKEFGDELDVVVKFSATAAG